MMPLSSKDFEGFTVEVGDPKPLELLKPLPPGMALCRRGHVKPARAGCLECMKIVWEMHRRELSDKYIKRLLNWPDAPPWAIKIKRATILLHRSVIGINSKLPEGYQ